MESAERIAPSYRKALEIEIALWDGFRRALRGSEVETFDKMMNDCRMYASAGDKAPRPFTIEAMFMSILLSQQKELTEIEEGFEQLEKQLTVSLNRVSLEHDSSNCALG
jgi:CRISPR/Cas system CSM-associated protein Csm3 (group 7 of RAMP superfamily)